MTIHLEKIGTKMWKASNEDGAFLGYVHKEWRKRPTGLEHKSGWYEYNIAYKGNGVKLTGQTLKEIKAKLAKIEG